MTKHKILIADDQKDNIIAMYSILHQYNSGYEIIAAPNGKIAFELAQEFNPDLIILDWEMPVLTGIDAVKLLKSTNSTKSIPIIMATALASSENLQEAMAEGAMDYIKKPIDRIELIARVRSALVLYDSFKEIRNQKDTIENQSLELLARNNELRKLSIVASKTDNSVIIIDANGEIEWANEGFAKLGEMSIEEFKTKYGSNFHDVAKKLGFKKELDDCIRENKTVSYTIPFTTISNVKKWVQTTLTPIFNEKFELEKLIAVESDISKIKEQEELIIQEKKKTDELLLNILPAETAAELKAKGTATPRLYKKVSILFTDFKGFTKSCEGLSAGDIVSELHSYFAEFDDIIENHNLEKIKTIGDAYMCAGGLPIRNKTNPIDSVLAALKIQAYMNKLNKTRKNMGQHTWELRLGIHTGEVVAGVVGKKKFVYDIWGDAVNIASRMETAGEVGKVNISETTYNEIKDFFDCEHRGKIEAKNKGKIDMYFVTQISKEYSVDGKGIVPNDDFLKVLAEM